MNKNKQRGMTLVELIISFMLVSVAILYFFQTLKTVQKIYSDSFDTTNYYVNKSYAFRVIKEYYIKNEGDMSDFDSDIIPYLEDLPETCSNPTPTNVTCLEVQINGETSKLYLYYDNNETSNEDESNLEED